MACCNDSQNCSHHDEEESTAKKTDLTSIRVEGIPASVPKGVAEICKARLTEAVDELLELAGSREVLITVGNSAPPSQPPQPRATGSAAKRGDEPSLEERAEQYKSIKPFYDFEFLVVPHELRESLLSAMDLARLETLVFDEWNLRAIEPFPRTALNFHGLPGTGKTLAAHALASYIGRPILMANYGQIESKYVGDGAKNVEAIFFAAERDGSVLFIDEADSLLSKRLTNVTQGAEQAINSMRSQLLVCLELFKGTVIFSTNLVENYDRAFETRVRNIYFPMPDEECRRRIWSKHLPKQLPLKADVSVDDLARIPELCGRDIKSAVIDAALRAARADAKSIGQNDLLNAVERVKSARIQNAQVREPEPAPSF